MQRIGRQFVLILRALATLSAMAGAASLTAAAPTQELELSSSLTGLVKLGTSGLRVRGASVPVNVTFGGTMFTLNQSAPQVYGPTLPTVGASKNFPLRLSDSASFGAAKNSFYGPQLPSTSSGGSAGSDSASSGAIFNSGFNLGTYTLINPDATISYSNLGLSGLTFGSASVTASRVSQLPLSVSDVTSAGSGVSVIDSFSAYSGTTYSSWLLNQPTFSEFTPIVGGEEIVRYTWFGDDFDTQAAANSFADNPWLNYTWFGTEPETQAAVVNSFVSGSTGTGQLVSLPEPEAIILALLASIAAPWLVRRRMQA